MVLSQQSRQLRHIGSCMSLYAHLPLHAPPRLHKMSTRLSTLAEQLRGSRLITATSRACISRYEAGMQMGDNTLLLLLLLLLLLGSYQLPEGLITSSPA